MNMTLHKSRLNISKHVFDRIRASKQTFSRFELLRIIQCDLNLIRVGYNDSKRVRASQSGHGKVLFIFLILLFVTKCLRMGLVDWTFEDLLIG